MCLAVMVVTLPPSFAHADCGALEVLRNRLAGICDKKQDAEARRAQLKEALEAAMKPPLPRSLGPLVDRIPEGNGIHVIDASNKKLQTACKAIVTAATETRGVSPDALRQCWGDISEPPTSTTPAESAIAVRTSVGSNVRMFTAEGTEVPRLAVTDDQSRTVYAVVPTRTLVLVAHQHPATVTGSVPPNLVKTWQVELFYPIASVMPPLSRPASFGCRTFELRKEQGSKLYVDGVAIPTTSPRTPDVQLATVQLPVGHHELTLLSPNKRLTREFEVDDDSIGQCPVEVLDSRGSEDIALVHMSVAPACMRIGVDASAVINAVSQQLGGDRLRDMRQVDLVLSALGDTDRAFAGRNAAGPLSWGRPIDDVARSLYGAGIRNALALSVECAPREPSASVTVTAARVDTQRAWEQNVAGDIVTIRSHTVNGLGQLRGAVRVAVNRAFESPSIWLRPPFRQHHYRTTGLNIALDTSGNRCKGGSHRIMLNYQRDDDGNLCDANRQRRMLLNHSEDRLPNPESRTCHNWEGRGEQRLDFRPAGAGTYLVEVTLQCQEGAETDFVDVARDARCISVVAPRAWWRVDFGGGGSVSEFGPATTVKRVAVEATLIKDGQSGAFNGGAFVGYAFSSVEAGVPRDWNDLRTTLSEYRDGTAPIQWQRHSVRAGPVIQFMVEPNRYNSGWPVWHHHSVEFRPSIDLTLLYMRDVPEGFRVLRAGASSNYALDLDVDLTFKLGVLGGRIPTTHDVSLDMFFVVDFLAVDDLFDKEQSISNSAGVILGAEGAWGMGL
ncbi:MAG: hypothetical protein R3B72_49600 [Polyangiaceae bacterium]